MNIAIVKLSAIGDIVHAMAVLQFIKRALPESQIDWIVEERFASILEGNPHIGRILPLNLKAIKSHTAEIFSQARLISEYAKNSYDIVIDLQGLIKSSLVARMLGPSVGFDKDSIREKPASLLYGTTFHLPYKENVISRNLQLVCSALGIEFDMEMLCTKEPFLYFDENERRVSAPYVTRNHKNILYIMGSSWESKIYPKEKLAEVIRGIGENAILVWGSNNEYAAARSVAEKTKASVAPRLTIGELKALISRADLVIGGDSGPTHFAWAMNRPSITLFGPTPASRNTLEGGYTRTLSSSSIVDPLRLNKEDFSIGEIEPAQIIALAKELLQKPLMAHMGQK